jgi:hypothetical protein
MYNMLCAALITLGFLFVMGAVGSETFSIMEMVLYAVVGMVAVICGVSLYEDEDYELC